jgi:hypothetical protein
MADAMTMNLDTVNCQIRPAPRARSWLVAALTFVVFAFLAFAAGQAQAAQPPVNLGTADSFAVLAGSTVTNTGASTLNGNLGLSPGTAITGFPPGKVNGTTHAADAVALQAQTDLTTAYNDAAGRTPPAAVSGDLGGSTLAPGVYKSGSSLGLTGVLTLDAEGDPNAVFVFQAGSTLTTASSSSVALVNGAQPCNVFWQIGSSATLGTSSTLAGNVLALTSISVNDGVTVNGRLLARNGAVTLINDTISAARCAAGTTGGGTGTGTGAEPGAGGTNGTNGTTGPGSTGPGTTGTGTPGTRAAPPQIGRGRCVAGSFRAVVTGKSIRRVVFSMAGRTIVTRRSSPFEALIGPGLGVRTVSARVTFTDTRRAVTLKMRFKACAAGTRKVRVVSPSKPPLIPPVFTG